MAIKIGIVFKLVVISMLLYLTIPNLHAKPKDSSDSLNVILYYPCGSSSVSKMPGNTQSLNFFIHQLDSLCQSPSITPASLFVTSSTSPEGSLKINKTLARKRNQSVINYLNRHSEAFRNFSTSLEYKKKRRTTNHRLGKIRRSAYPSLRYSKLTLYLDREKSGVYAMEELPAIQNIAESIYSAEMQIPERIEETSSVFTHETADSVTTGCPLFWVKTNLLYDLMTFVNASVEIPLTKNITAEATLVYPWWRSTSRHKTIQMRYVAVTPRYYFNNADRSYTSLFAGLTVGGGKYDLQWTRRGVQGSMWHVSPVIGYSHHISKRWKMEYSASVGFVHTKYQKYTQTSDTPYGEIKVKDYPWVSKVLNTVLPTSLNVSIVYTFTKSKQIGHHEE